MAFSVAENDEWRNQRWTESLRRSATLLEPVWPKTYSDGPFMHALPTVALLLYAGPFDDDPEFVPVADIVTALTPHLANPAGPPLKDTVRVGLIERRHDLDDDSPLSSLVRQLTTHQPALALPPTSPEPAGADDWSGGTLMGAAAEWAHPALAGHYLPHIGA
ncbi:hypothetical protein GKJPGBOP_01482 [Streptomyces paromomycinus]|uniref:Uncharacterized protein n=2 Tax=Streptomyces paromomycinus TaxID=92743 RepID=A0A401VXQ6_STREY|nr:hypothetical protein GKJPGBOP_01482 [Streptomyces paromomycinus]